MKEHSLIDRQNGKTTKLKCEGNELIIETETGGKTRSVSKTFADETPVLARISELGKNVGLLVPNCYTRTPHNGAPPGGEI